MNKLNCLGIGAPMPLKTETDTLDDSFLKFRREVNSPQFGLPFDDFGLTAPIDELVANQLRVQQAIKAVRTRRTKKIDASLEGVNLDLPLPMFVLQEEFRMGEEFHDRTARAIYSIDNMPDDFGYPSVEVCCSLFAGLFYQQLRIILEPRFSSENRREAIEWMLADYYESDGMDAKKPMRLIPFTAQIACEVEEIDYDEFRVRLEVAIEMAKQEQQSRSDDMVSMVEIDHKTQPLLTNEGEFHKENHHENGTRPYQTAVWTGVQANH